MATPQRAVAVVRGRAAISAPPATARLRMERTAPVRLADGPYDGRRVQAAPGEVLKFEADGPTSGSSGPALLLAWYVPSEDDAAVYVFAGVERDALRMHATGQPLPRGAGPAKPRVYELAAEFGVESRAVMAKLQEMGGSSARLPRQSSTSLHEGSGSSSSPPRQRPQPGRLADKPRGSGHLTVACRAAPNCPSVSHRPKHESS